MFDPKKEIIFATNASERAIPAVVSQEIHPFLYLSRKLSWAKCNYSNMERKSLGIV